MYTFFSTASIRTDEELDGKQVSEILLSIYVCNKSNPLCMYVCV